MHVCRGKQSVPQVENFKFIGVVESFASTRTEKAVPLVHNLYVGAIRKTKVFFKGGSKI
jgi:hypothetical protein